MYCLPACQPCRVAGICPKGEVPATPVSAPVTRTRSRTPSVVRRTQIDKAYGTYIRLKCGHTTTKDAQEAYALWRPKGRGQRRKFYCESLCSKWVEAEQPPKPTPKNNPNPLF